MADVILRIINEGVTEANQGVSSVGKAYDDLSKSSKKATETQSKGFKDSADGAQKFNDILDKTPPKVAKPISEIKKLKDEIRKFTNEALAAGQGTDKFAKAIAEAGKKKADLKDLQQAVSLLDPDVKAKAFLNLSQTIISGFAAGAGALAAFGVSTEDAQKTLVKLQAAMAFGQFLGQVGELGDTFKVLQVQIKNSEIAQKAFNLVSKANPYVIIAASVVALAAAVAAFTNSENENTEALKENAEAVKKIVDETDKYKEKIKETERAIDDILSLGSDFDKKRKKAQDAFNEQAKKDEEEATKDLNEIFAKGKDDFGNLDATTKMIYDERDKAYKEKRKQLERSFQKEVQEINLLEIEDGFKKAAENAENELKVKKENNKKIIEERNKLLEDTKFEVKQAADEEINITQETNQRIISEEEKLIDEQNQILFRDQDSRKEFLETFGKTDLELKIKQIDEETKKILENTAFTESERRAIIADSEKKISDLKQTQLNNQLISLSQQFANIQSLENAFGAETKAGASAQALIATYLSAQKSFAFGAGIGGPILGGIFAAIATAAGLANVAKINEVQFAEGGYTGNGGKYDEAGTVHKGEFVMTKEKTAKHRNLFEAIHNDQQLGFADLASLLKGTGVSLNPDVPTNILKAYDNHDQRQITIKSESDKRLANIEKKFDKLLNQQANKEQHSQNSDGSQVIKKGNVTRIIRRRKS